MSAPDVQFITPDWPAAPGVRAAFTLRIGGVSVAPYDSLNLGARIGDLPEAVRENRRRLREELRLPAEPIWLEQVHGTEVVELGATVAGVPSASGVAGALGVEGTAALLRAAGAGTRRPPHITPRGDASIARRAGWV